MSNVIGIKGAHEAPRSQRSSMETLIVSLEQVNQWKIPSFQRPLRINAKIHALAEEIKRDGVSIPGIITLGKLGRVGDLYIVDGQHRLEAFRMSGLEEAIVDVRVINFDSMSEMAEEFNQLNTALVRMRPDDIMRALEPMTRSLQRIRSECGYVGYDNIRRGGTNSPIVGMSMLLRSWEGSSTETPVSSPSGRTATNIAKDMDDTSTSNLIKFLHLAYSAWGRDPEYFRLWGSLNLTMCMWLYRRCVLNKERGVKRYIVMNDQQFRQCMMAMSADSGYLDFLVGRNLTERDRNPCYSHIKKIFTKRLQTHGIARPMFPNAAWAI